MSLRGTQCQSNLWSPLSLVIASEAKQSPFQSRIAGSASPPCLHNVGYCRPATRALRSLLCSSYFVVLCRVFANVKASFVSLKSRIDAVIMGRLSLRAKRSNQLKLSLYKRFALQVGRSRRCASMEARPSLQRGPLNGFWRLLSCARNDDCSQRRLLAMTTNLGQ